jgi:hypothetical protein
VTAGGRRLLLPARAGGSGGCTQPGKAGNTVTDRRQKAIEIAFRKFRPGCGYLQITEEHGQEWVTEQWTGGQWAVEDAVRNGVPFFDFEQVTAPNDD